MEIPTRLLNKNFRFIKISPGTKKPSEENWTKENSYKFNDPDFLRYLKTATAYGILCGYGQLCIIDCDKKEIESDVFLHLPNTFTVQTGSGGTHFYYIVEGLQDKIVMTNDKNVHFGECQFTGAQALGVGSLHPNGKHYEILQNNKIETITKEQLDKVVKPYTKTKKTFVSNNTSNINLDISIVADTIPGLDKNKKGELQGCHPIHGSSKGEKGNNLCINTDTNKFHCFHCGTGGDTLYLIAILEEFMDCSDCVPGYFTEHPDVFLETLKVARDKYGYTDIHIRSELNKWDLLQEYNVWNDKKILYPNLAKLILVECALHLFICNDESTKRAEIYYYDKDKGYYCNDGETEIRRQVNKFLGNKTTEKGKSEVLGYIKDTCERFDRSEIEPPVNLINCKNGILNIETLEKIDHTPNYKFLNQIPIEWSPEAKCPKIQKFLKQILPKDDIERVLEIFGFTLYRDYIFQKAFIFYGAGSNGKGITLRLLQEMLGTSNISTESLTALQKDTYAKASLYGKMANISGEMSYEALRDCKNFKELNGQDFISAQKKYRDTFTFQNYAKLIFNTNKIPWTGDKSFAFYRRVVIINFLKTFMGKADNTHLFEELSTRDEMQGLLVKVVCALKQLLKQDDIYKIISVEDMEEYYESLTNLEKDWLSEHYKVNEVEIDNGGTQLNMIHGKYQEFCTKEKLPCKTKHQLLREIKNLYKNTEMRVKTTRMDGKRYITFMGLCVKT